MNDPILQEIYEIRRKHWIEAGGTREGLRAYHERVSREISEKGPEAFLRERLAARRKEREARELVGGAMVVCEGEAPRYGAGKTSDLARKGGEGEG